MSQRVVMIRHGDEPVDDRVTTFFRACNIEPEVVRPFKGEPLGTPNDSVMASVVYGGRFEVFDEGLHPFLHDENRWIEQCMRHDVPLLGICQGAQSIAHVLGARCGPIAGEPHEFGYYPIYATQAGKAWLPDRLVVTQSHFHEFALPSGAELLARSDLFPQQAFRYGETTFALQFHAEVTRTGFARWQETGENRYGKPGVQTKAEQDDLGAQHDPDQHHWFMGFLERLFSSAVADVSGKAA